MADVAFQFHGAKLGLTPASTPEETRAAILHAIENYGAVVVERDEYRRQVVELSGGRGAPIEGVPGLRGGFEPVTASRSARGSVRSKEMVEFDARRAAMKAEDAARRVEASRPATGAVQEALTRAQASGGDPKAVVATDPELRERCARDPLSGPFPTAQAEVDARYLRAFAADPAIKSGEFLKNLYAADPALRARANRERHAAARVPVHKMRQDGK